VRVDRIVSRRDVVIKPLGRGLRDLRALAGAAELGDEGVTLVLDPAALLEDLLASGPPSRWGPRSAIPPRRPGWSTRSSRCSLAMRPCRSWRCTRSAHRSRVRGSTRSRGAADRCWRSRPWRWRPRRRPRRRSSFSTRRQGTETPRCASRRPRRSHRFAGRARPALPRVDGGAGPGGRDAHRALVGGRGGVSASQELTLSIGGQRPVRTRCIQAASETVPTRRARVRSKRPAHCVRSAAV